MIKPPDRAALQGLHLVADAQGCACAPALLCEVETLKALMQRAVSVAGLTVVGEVFHRFPDQGLQPGGVTGTLLLAESHVAVHTWPEFGVVTLDVYVCNYSADNSGRAETLMACLLDLFKAAVVNRQSMMRSLQGAEIF